MFRSVRQVAPLTDVIGGIGDKSTVSDCISYYFVSVGMRIIGPACLSVCLIDYLKNVVRILPKFPYMLPMAVD